MSSSATSYLTVVVHNGLANRLLPLISCYRLARKTNRKLNIVFNGTPVRSCIRYDGIECKYYDLFKPRDDIIVDMNQQDIHYDRVFNFEYWLNKDMIIDISGDCNIYTNYGLYTIISQDDDQTSICKNLKFVIMKSGEVVFDDIAIELGDILRNDIKPVDELQLEINKYQSRFKKHMVGLHIRSTDGGFTSIQWNAMVQDLIQKCLVWCKASPDNGIFLATDNSKYYIDFAMKLTTDQFIFYNPPEILCQTKSTNVDKFNNDKFNVLCATIEMHLLGHCHHLIIGTSSSTFSVCGMLLAQPNTTKILIQQLEDIPSSF
jgi:hypothetical protein